MGVPRLFAWVKNNFSSHIVHFQQGEEITTVDALYVDANPLLHSATQFVNNTSSTPRFIDLYANLSEDEKTIKSYELFFDKIVDITKMVIPTKILYIAIDGPAPRAKQNQQRERRFVAAKHRKEKELLLESEDSSKKTLFNSTQLTPGTIFMHELTKYINYSIRKEMSTNKAWQSLNVYFSPCSSPGEGEHKCLDFIRELSDDEKKNYKHCIFGPDGDLIMLTMSAHVPNIFLFREDQYNIGYQDYLDMGAIIKELPGKLSQKRPLYDVVNDFIVEGFFVGNDFLPKIQMFHLLEDGLELMINTYSRTSRGGSMERNVLTNKGELNLNGFREFIKELSKYEGKYLIDQVTTKNPKKQPPEEKYINKTLKDSILETAQQSNIPHYTGKYVLDWVKFRRGYYAKSFGESFTDGDVREMCSSYLKSFIWVLKYYVKGLPSWGWAYEYHYAPLMIDFNKYVETLNNNDFNELTKFELENPSLPFEQLISVIPPTSAYLLPHNFGELITSKESPLYKKGYYPPLETIDIDYEGKLKEYEGIVKLKFVDYKLIKSAYENVIAAKGIDMKKYHRNIQGAYKIVSSSKQSSSSKVPTVSSSYPLYKFIHTPNKTGVRYISRFGKLSNIFIRKSLA